MSTCNSSRLLHGDENPRGPGFQEREIACSVNGRYAAGPQEIFRGSFAQLETPAPLIEEADFEIDLWIWPTLPGHGPQGILSWRAPDCADGLVLALEGSGRVVAQSGTREILRCREPLMSRVWARIRLEGRGSRFRLEVSPRDYSPRYETADVREATFNGDSRLFGRCLTLAATHVDAARKATSASRGLQRQDCEAPPPLGGRDAMRIRLFDRTAGAPTHRR